jgi:hypothetical protein
MHFAFAERNTMSENKKNEEKAPEMESRQFHAFGKLAADGFDTNLTINTPVKKKDGFDKATEAAFVGLEVAAGLFVVGKTVEVGVSTYKNAQVPAGGFNNGDMST